MNSITLDTLGYNPQGAAVDTPPTQGPMGVSENSVLMLPLPTLPSLVTVSCRTALNSIRPPTTPQGIPTASVTLNSRCRHHLFPRHLIQRASTLRTAGAGRLLWPPPHLSAPHLSKGQPVLTLATLVQTLGTDLASQLFVPHPHPVR